MYYYTLLYITDIDTGSTTYVLDLCTQSTTNSDKTDDSEKTVDEEYEQKDLVLEIEPMNR